MIFPDALMSGGMKPLKAFLFRLLFLLGNKAYSDRDAVYDRNILTPTFTRRTSSPDTFSSISTM